MEPTLTYKHKVQKGTGKGIIKCAQIYHHSSPKVKQETVEAGHNGRDKDP